MGEWKINKIGPTPSEQPKQVTEGTIYVDRINQLRNVLAQTDVSEVNNLRSFITGRVLADMQIDAQEMFDIRSKLEHAVWAASGDTSFRVEVPTSEEMLDFLVDAKILTPKDLLKSGKGGSTRQSVDTYVAPDYLQNSPLAIGNDPVGFIKRAGKPAKKAPSASANIVRSNVEAPQTARMFIRDPNNHKFVGIIRYRVAGSTPDIRAEDLTSFALPSGMTKQDVIDHITANPPSAINRDGEPEYYVDSRLFMAPEVVKVPEPKVLTEDDIRFADWKAGTNQIYWNNRRREEWAVRRGYMSPEFMSQPKQPQPNYAVYDTRGIYSRHGIDAFGRPLPRPIITEVTTVMPSAQPSINPEVEEAQTRFEWFKMRKEGKVSMTYDQYLALKTAAQMLEGGAIDPLDAVSKYNHLYDAKTGRIVLFHESGKGKAVIIDELGRWDMPFEFSSLDDLTTKFYGKAAPKLEAVKPQVAQKALPTKEQWETMRKEGKTNMTWEQFEASKKVVEQIDGGKTKDPNALYDLYATYTSIHDPKTNVIALYPRTEKGEAIIIEANGKIGRKIPFSSLKELQSIAFAPPKIEPVPDLAFTPFEQTREGILKTQTDSLATINGTFPIADQRAALQKFNQSVLLHELQLSDEQIRKQYEFYNASKDKDGETQKLQAEVLRIIEANIEIPPQTTVKVTVEKKDGTKMSAEVKEAETGTPTLAPETPETKLLSQRSALNTATDVSISSDKRWIAVNEFYANVEKNGFLLSDADIRKQYALYNASESLDIETKEIMKFVITIIEAHIEVPEAPVAVTVTKKDGSKATVEVKEGTPTPAVAPAPTPSPIKEFLKKYAPSLLWFFGRKSSAPEAPTATVAPIVSSNPETTPEKAPNTVETAKILVDIEAASLKNQDFGPIVQKFSKQFQKHSVDERKQIILGARGAYQRGIRGPDFAGLAKNAVLEGDTLRLEYPSGLLVRLSENGNVTATKVVLGAGSKARFLDTDPGPLTKEKFADSQAWLFSQQTNIAISGKDLLPYIREDKNPRPTNNDFHNSFADPYVID